MCPNKCDDCKKTHGKFLLYELEEILDNLLGVDCAWFYFGSMDSLLIKWIHILKWNIGQKIFDYRSYKSDITMEI